MIRLPEALADKVRALAASIPDERIHDDADGEMGREDSPHVTVKYGLHTDDTEEVREKMTTRWPIKARLGKASIFDAPDYIVLKFEITGTALRALNSFVCKEFECTDTHPEYNPHATIAYLKKDKDNPDFWKGFAADELAGEEFEVDKVEWSPAGPEKVMIPLKAEKPAQRVARLGARVAMWVCDEGC